MRRRIALLLVVCVVAGLVACGNKTENSASPTDVAADIAATDDSRATQAPMPTEETMSNVESAPSGNAPTAVTTETIATVATNAAEATTATKATETTKPDPSDSPFNGKTIEIYGLGSETSYTNYSQYDGKYQWMMRAAVVEWAEINGVKLVFAGAYDQNKILSAIGVGDRPDVIFHTDKFPAIANVAISAAFTDAEYKKLAAICGSEYLNMLNYKADSHGLVLPWAGNTVCYYNKTLFNKYNVKTPKEYFMEGEWTWENFQKCLEQMTIDTNADGEIDIYGLPGDSLACCPMVNPFKTDDAGKLLNTIDDPMIQDFFQFKYDVFTEKKCVVPAKNNIQTNVEFPMFAMQLSGCELYNTKQLYQSIPNGNELEVVPVPAYEGRNLLQWTQACVSLASTCDEREVAVDMLAYLLKCGMKYMSDYALGTIECDYEGIQGACMLSAEFVNAFAKLCTQDSKYDRALVSKMYESFQGAEYYTYQTYMGVTQLTSYGEITQMPPESAIPVVKAKYETDIIMYNDLYFTES